MKFTKEKVEELVWENEVERIEGENRRWSRTNISIVQKDGKFYKLYWEQGLTEEQENDFEDQDAPEVIQKEKVITVKAWEEVVKEPN